MGGVAQLGANMQFWLDLTVGQSESSAEAGKGPFCAGPKDPSLGGVQVADLIRLDWQTCPIRLGERPLVMFRQQMTKDCNEHETEAKAEHVPQNGAALFRTVKLGEQIDCAEVDEISRREGYEKSQV
jgi:hypothetical protein